MNFFSLEALWRRRVFDNFGNWDAVADSINPLLALLLLGAALWISRDSHARAWRFLGRSLLALVLTFLIVKIAQKLDWFEVGRSGIKGDFPSTHMAVCASLVTSLWSLNRRWIWLAPLLFFYAWLMTALRFHLWIDIVGGALIAMLATLAIQLVFSRSRRAERATTAAIKSSGRGKNARTSSTRISKSSSNGANRGSKKRAAR